MLKRFFSEILIDLGELEGDYRVFHLKNDIAQTVLALNIAMLSILAMLRVDTILFLDRPKLFIWVVAYRGSFVLATILVMLATRRVRKVRVYDRLVFAWIVLMILFFVLFGFTRPSNYLTIAYEIIIPFSIYVLSPLKIKQNAALAVSFTAAMMFVDYFFKTPVDPMILEHHHYCPVHRAYTWIRFGIADPVLSPQILQSLYAGKRCKGNGGISGKY